MTMLSARRAHTTLPSSDVEALRPFYEAVLGFTPKAVRPGAVIYDAGAGTIFAISRSGVPSSGSHTQIAFTVDDIEAEVADLHRRGVTFEDYETPKTEGGIATIGPGRAAWFKDQQQNLLAIIQFHDPV
jgi:predicted enzyme related to lactoylglutathione lyase